MGRKLKATHYWSSECEVTGGVDTSQEENVICLDNVREGLKLFPDSNIEWLHGNVAVRCITPTGVVIASSSEKFNIMPGTPYHTGTYTIDGRHKWCYSFEIIDG